jgi:glycosyltransferase involved in cell wall biosynthesis
MKILVLFGPDQFGGSFVIAENIARIYKENGHEIIMVVKDPYAIKRYKDQGYNVLTIVSMQRSINILRDIMSSYHLMKIYKEHNCDVIHSHTSKGGFYSRVAKLLCKKIRVIHTVHGYYSSSNRFKNVIYQMIEKVLLPFGDVTTFVNYEDYQNTKSHISKLIYIPNGVDIDYFKVKHEFYDSVFNIIVNARIVWEKGYKEVIDIVRRFSNENIHFHIVGTGSDEAEVKKELLGCHSVTFHGFVKDIRTVLNQAHLNLLLSYREGLSLSILEAMASGIPTIGYDIRGNRELVEYNYNGYLFPLHEIKELEDCIQKYYSDRDLCALHGERARRKVCELYNADTTYSLYNKVLEELIYES